MDVRVLQSPVLRRALLLAPLPATAFTAGPSLDHAIALQTAGRLPEALREYHSLAGSSDPEVAATALSNACVIPPMTGSSEHGARDVNQGSRNFLQFDSPPGKKRSEGILYRLERAGSHHCEALFRAGGDSGGSS